MQLRRIDAKELNYIFPIGQKEIVRVVVRQLRTDYFIVELQNKDTKNFTWHTIYSGETKTFEGCNSHVNKWEKMMGASGLKC